MKTPLHFIPNTLTCLNLTAGCIAITLVPYGEFTTVFWLIIAACVFDFLDGFAARMLDAHSPIGADLDSLADMVSFGVVPSMILYRMLASICMEFPYIAFLVAVFSALRLAKFNVDTRQSEEFRGLATPASTLLVVSLAAVSLDPAYAPYLNWLTANPVSLVIFIVILSLLMVCDMPMFSFKFKKFGLRENSLRYGFIVFAVLAVIFFRYAAPAVIVLVYILVSVCLWLLRPRPASGKNT